MLFHIFMGDTILFFLFWGYGILISLGFAGKGIDSLEFESEYFIPCSIYYLFNIQF